MGATLVELARAGRENTPAGQKALVLAFRIEHADGETGSSLAALAKAHSIALAEAVAGVERKSPIDELKARRDAKRAGGQP